MEEALQKERIDYSYDYPVRSKYGYRIDFALIEQMIIIECDGEAWHPEGNLHDKRRDGYFRSRGWTVLRFKGQQIKDNINECIRQIMEAIKNEKNKCRS